MARNPIIASLEKKYARLKGEAFAIEKEAEDAVGAELRDKIQEIYNRQRKIWATMKEIESTIQKLYDPTWSGERVRGIRPVKAGLPAGTISKRALKALRDAEEPQTTKQILTQVKQELIAEGYEMQDRVRLRNGIHAALASRVGKNVLRHETSPTTWTYLSQARRGS